MPSEFVLANIQEHFGLPFSLSYGHIQIFFCIPVPYFGLSFGTSKAHCYFAPWTWLKNNNCHVYDKINILYYAEKLKYFSSFAPLKKFHSKLSINTADYSLFKATTEPFILSCSLTCVCRLNGSSSSTPGNSTNFFFHKKSHMLPKAQNNTTIN